MKTIFTLDNPGTVSAILLGTAVFFLGINYGVFFLADLIFFLVISTIVTSAGKHRKMWMGTYEKSRTWKNVAANGAIPLLWTVVYAAAYVLNRHFTTLILIAYIASISAVMADKFASELGVLDGEPYTLLTLKKAKKGTSGAVTPFGLFASLFGSAVIAMSVFVLYSNVYYFVIIAVSGLFGSLTDSIFGYFEEKGVGNKYTSNIACAVAGSLLSVLLLALL